MRSCETPQKLTKHRPRELDGERRPANTRVTVWSIRGWYLRRRSVRSRPRAMMGGQRRPLYPRKYTFAGGAVDAGDTLRRPHPRGGQFRIWSSATRVPMFFKAFGPIVPLISALIPSWAIIGFGLKTYDSFRTSPFARRRCTSTCGSSLWVLLPDRSHARNRLGQ